MELARLLSVLEPLPQAPGGLDITGLAYDSRRVGPGDVFFAIEGLVHDGHEFCDDAIGRGARAVVCERPVPAPPGFPVIVTPDSRLALALCAAQFHGHPSTRLRLIGVTGTNGKTTTTYLIRSILEAAGHRTGLIGTITADIAGEPCRIARTTPESLELQSLFRRMVAAGVTHAVMEVSSHALTLKRVAGTEFDVGVLTNVTQDHLDFHRDFTDYLRAKETLFTGLGSSYRVHPKPGKKAAVINCDDGGGADILERGGLQVPVITYGLSPGSLVRGRDVAADAAGSRLRVAFPRGETRLTLGLSGRFNVYNALAAFATGLVEGVPVSLIIDTLARQQGVPGRFERVGADLGLPFTVIVDYAHTPDGLENALRTARELAAGRVIVVFGCGGDRDRGKRPVMGRVAAAMADFVVVTSDNPRSEPPETIIDEIVAGIPPDAHAAWEVEPDRARAIRDALEAAGEGDLVLIAGKGHETYQEVAGCTLPFDDREVARRTLKDLRLRGGA